MKRIVMLALLVLLTAGARFKDNERVLAKYGGGEDWYVGLVKKQQDGKIEIAYLDGSSDTLPPNLVRAFDWKVGTKVSCDFKREHTWYHGTITKLDGNAVHIRYDDGDEEDTSLAYCRFNPKDKE